MNRRTPLALALGLTATLTLAGCSSDGGSSGPPELSVSSGYMPQPVSDLAAGFLTITNSGGAADKLTSVTGDLSDDITIHKTENQKMMKVASFDIPADGELDLERGGNHIMFMDIKHRPRQGENVSIELHFEKADPITVELPVKETTYNPAQQ
ncbi:copper chaperone PCu(A)C [Streptomyces sp. NBC_00872]|uniref:copper chaperone PCu(A)C n=1 Tax=Streptomyces sp. NBC_00872 TaxID=2903686 RepID=UPI0038673C1E|nr:copper chaperone PCu(A)C [Streptomyces sp. NBC_00872]